MLSDILFQAHLTMFFTHDLLSPVAVSNTLSLQTSLIPTLALFAPVLLSATDTRKPIQVNAVTDSAPVGGKEKTTHLLVFIPGMQLKVPI